MDMVLVTEVCGLDPERDETQYPFASGEELKRFLRDTSVRFADHLAGLKHEFPGHDLNNLGPEYLGVGYAVTIRNSEGKELHIGVSPMHWAIVGLGEDSPANVGVGSSSERVVFYFGDWTELPASETYCPESAWARIERWLAVVEAT
jgi:hypothetical protein